MPAPSTVSEFTSTSMVLEIWPGANTRDPGSFGTKSVPAVAVPASVTYPRVSGEAWARLRWTKNCARRWPLSPSWTAPLDTVRTGFGPVNPSASTIVAVPVLSPTDAPPPWTPSTTIEKDSSGSVSTSDATGTLIVVCSAPVGMVIDRGDATVPQVW